LPKVAEALLLAARLRELVGGRTAEIVVLLRAFTHVAAFERALPTPASILRRRWPGLLSQQQTDFAACSPQPPIPDESPLRRLPGPLAGCS
jgi:hypothetical protein